MKKQRNEKPIDEELLMRMMAGEAAGTGEPGTGKEETAVPVEKAQELSLIHISEPTRH